MLLGLKKWHLDIFFDLLIKASRIYVFYTLIDIAAKDIPVVICFQNGSLTY
ncbi:hypothetical protein BH10BAC1_BH10BAC1_20290 [soil metagenome]